MGLFKNYVNQTRKAEGLLGRMMIKGMNSGHAKMADWGLDHLKIVMPEEIVDIGCGGGRNAGELLKKYPKARVTAVDYSPLAVKQTAEYNKSAVAAGRCVVMQGDMSALNLDEGRYSLATAFETIYFWGNLSQALTEVARVLKPGGLFLICCEASNPADDTWTSRIDGMVVYDADELQARLAPCGVSDFVVHHRHKENICLVAQKNA